MRSVCGRRGPFVGANPGGVILAAGADFVPVDVGRGTTKKQPKPLINWGF